MSQRYLLTQVVGTIATSYIPSNGLDLQRRLAQATTATYKRLKNVPLARRSISNKMPIHNPSGRYICIDVPDQSWDGGADRADLVHSLGHWSALVGQRDRLTVSGVWPVWRRTADF